MTHLAQLDAEVGDALERVRVPAYVIDEYGIVRWVNAAAQQIVGDIRGKHLTSVVAPVSASAGSDSEPEVARFATETLGWASVPE